MNLLQWVTVYCPYCGEANEVAIDTSVLSQEIIEDCTVCCRPMLLRLAVDASGEINVAVRRENE